MHITGNEGEPISRERAKRWTANYRANDETNRRGKINSHLFGIEKVRELLDQEGCVGMRIYYALNDEGVQQLLLVATDEDGNDLKESEVLDRSVACPPDCGSIDEFGS